MKINVLGMGCFELIPDNYQDKIWLAHFAMKSEQEGTENVELNFTNGSSGGYCDPYRLIMFSCDENDKYIEGREADIDEDDISSLYITAYNT